MKKLVKVEEVQGEGLIALMGECVTLFCANYIYAGTLIGVNDTFVKLDNAHIIYETGSFTDKKFKDAQRLSHDIWYVRTEFVESFGLLKDLA